VNQDARQSERYLQELRLFLEDLCCDLCRFEHTTKDGVEARDVKITEEIYLGVPGAFADIRVQVNGRRPYFVEVKYGYPASRVAAVLTRKYGPSSRLGDAFKVVVVLDSQCFADWPEIAPQVQSGLREGLQIEVWDEATFLSMLRERFDVELTSLCQQDVHELRAALHGAKGRYAFEDTWVNDDVQNSLLWHYGFWRLRQLRLANGRSVRSIMPPGMYKGVAVVMADLCGYSSYVRDTREDEVIRHCLTSFYAKTRYEILNTGGMMYQFVGDEVIGLYGMPDCQDGYLEAALECVRALVDIGDSISNEWQRHIDQVQSVRGVHIGVAVGDIQIVSLRPFSRAHLGAVGDVINMAARLVAHAGPGEILVSNTFFQGLGQSSQATFREYQTVDAKNMGTIQAWKANVEQSQP
jgi:adenylate cyclase